MVAEEGGRPLADATVLLLRPGHPVVDSTRTDADGRFHLTADSAGEHLLHVRPEGYLSWSEPVEIRTGGAVRQRVEMPLMATATARSMAETIQREAALQLPLAELCAEPLRPWEAGLLVGVARDRDTLEPVTGAVVSVSPGTNGQTGGEEAAREGRRRWSTVSAGSGAYWICNLPPGEHRVVAEAPGFRSDTSTAVIRAGTISWYDALLTSRPPPRQR